MAKTPIILQPHYILNGCNAPHQIKRLEMAVVILNSSGVLYRDFETNDDAISLLEVSVQDENSRFVLTPKKEKISEYGIILNNPSQNYFLTHLGPITWKGMSFDLEYKELDSNQFSRGLMLGESIGYKLLFSPKK